MRLAFVTPAWRRYDVSRLVFAQRHRLIGVLASRGVTASCVVVADDENLDLAREFGFDTVRAGNVLGMKINRGFTWGLEWEADYLTFVGSDDWLHPDLFDVPFEGKIISGRKLCQYDLETGQSKIVGTRSPYGTIPWFIPRELIPTLTPHRETGLDLELGRKIDRGQWFFHDPHPLARVDFKSDVGLTPFGAGIGPLGPSLETRYDRDLVDLVDEFRLVAA